MRGFLLRAALLCLPPPVCGRLDEADGGSFFLDGAGEAPFSALSVQRVGSWKTIYSSYSSTASFYRPALKAITSIQMPVKGSGINSTSQVRPLLRCATASNVGTATSGFVLASELDSGDSDLRLHGGDREGPYFVFLSFREALSTFIRDLCIIFFSYGVLCNNMYLHCVDLT
jgi:hypothetical protein